MKRIVLFLLLGMLLPPVAVQAGSVMGPSAYTKDELARVRAWEQQWAGKKIDKTTIDQVAAFLPESYVGLYKNPDKWGAPAEGLWFTIRPYEEVQETQGFQEATQKYSKLVKRTSDGSIINYGEIAGRPFPYPKDGMEMAYNVDFNNHGDTAHYRRFCPNISPQSRTERVGEMEFWEYNWVHRTEIEPLPAALGNTKGYRRGIYAQMYKPVEFLNMPYLCVSFIDAGKAYQRYTYRVGFHAPFLKISSTDSIDGTDLLYADEYLWDGYVSENSYIYKGKKELLCSRHTDMKQTTRSAGQAVVNGLMLERCSTLVVEAVNKDKNYYYSKRIWYLDPESYLILWTEIYDQFGKFWKCFMQNCDVLPTATGQKKHFIVGAQYADFQRTHAGLSNQQYYWEPKISEPGDPEMFTTNYFHKR